MPRSRSTTTSSSEPPTATVSRMPRTCCGRPTSGPSCFAGSVASRKPLSFDDPIEYFSSDDDPEARGWIVFLIAFRGLMLSVAGRRAQAIEQYGQVTDIVESDLFDFGEVTQVVFLNKGALMWHRGDFAGAATAYRWVFDRFWDSDSEELRASAEQAAAFAVTAFMKAGKRRDVWETAEALTERFPDSYRAVIMRGLRERRAIAIALDSGAWFSGGLDDPDRGSPAQPSGAP